MILDSSPTDRLVTEILTAVDGRVVALILLIGSCGVWARALSHTRADQLLYLHDQAEREDQP